MNIRDIVYCKDNDLYNIRSEIPAYNKNSLQLKICNRGGLGYDIFSFEMPWKFEFTELRIFPGRWLINTDLLKNFNPIFQTI